MISFWSVFVFLPPSSLLLLFLHYHYCLYCCSFYWLLLLSVITVIIISIELLALCDWCLGWGWVWWAGLVAGLWVGQTCGVLLLPGFGVSGSSPLVPGHSTSICDAGVKQYSQRFSKSKTMIQKVLLEKINQSKNKIT